MYIYIYIYIYIEFWAQFQCGPYLGTRSPRERGGLVSWLRHAEASGFVLRVEGCRFSGRRSISLIQGLRRALGDGWDLLMVLER